MLPFLPEQIVTIRWFYYLRATKKHDFTKYCNYVMILTPQCHKIPCLISLIVTAQRFILAGITKQLLGLEL